MKHLKYLTYVVRHKWFVMLECFKRGLIWRGLFHDSSKFLPNEWFPYAHYFYGKKRQIRDKSGYYKATDTGDPNFDKAWMRHQHRNDHHWQYWGVIEDDTGVFKPIRIPKVAIIEMVCDWIGAGKAQGHVSPPNDPYRETRNWYSANHKHMTIHPESKEEIERIIGYKQ